MSGHRLNLQISVESMKPTTTDASVSATRSGVHAVSGRLTTGSSEVKASSSNSAIASSLPLNKVGQVGQQSMLDSIHEDELTNRRYRSKDAHMKRFQQLVESSLAKPNGVLAIHIKVGRIYNIDSEGEVFSEGADLFVYLRMLCIDYVKYSRVYVVKETPTTIVLDELKHFYINVGSMKPDSFCFVRLEMLAFEESKRSLHHVFAMKEISLLQVVKCMYGSATLEMWRDEKQVAEVDIEACFSTGAFGYGYSSLFDIPDQSPKKQLGWSMFCRLAPPGDRSSGAGHGGSGAELIACREVARPGFVNFTRLAVLKPVGGAKRMSEPPERTSVLVGSMIGRRLAQKQVAFSHLRTRQERLKYLREFVIHPFSQAEETLISEDLHYFEEVNVRRTTVQTDDARLRYSIFTGEPDDRTSPHGVEVVASALDKSPSVIRRRQVNDPTDDQQASVKQDKRGTDK